jgi:hypothetical protein
LNDVPSSVIGFALYVTNTIPFSAAIAIDCGGCSRPQKCGRKTNAGSAIGGNPKIGLTAMQAKLRVRHVGRRFERISQAIEF